MQITENQLKNKITNLKENLSSLWDENEQMKSKLADDIDELAVKSKQINIISADKISLYEQNLKLQSQIDNFSFRDKKVGFDNTNQKNKARLIHTFAERAQSALWFADMFDLMPKVIKCESKNGKNVNVNLESDYSNTDFEDKRKLRELIYILDKFCVSDVAYHELAAACPDLPRKCQIIQERASIDDRFKTERCPGNVPGVYVSISREVFSYVRNNNIENDKPLKIKVADDGTKVSRISSFVTISMSFSEPDGRLIHDKLKTLAILKCNENYDMLSVCCSPIIKELNELIRNPCLTVDEKKI